MRLGDNLHREAVAVLARPPVVDPIAVADVEPIPGAEAPDGVLHEPREVGRELGIELARVGPAGQALDDVGTAARGIAARSVGVLGPEPTKDSGPVQKVVREGVEQLPAEGRTRVRTAGPTRPSQDHFCGNDDGARVCVNAFLTMQVHRSRATPQHKTHHGSSAARSASGEGHDVGQTQGTARGTP